MARFFHVDRLGALQLGAVLEPVPWSKIPDPVFPPVWRAHLESLLPRGLTNHGARYLGPEGPLKDEHKELLLDYVRRAHAAHLPSRYESIFACESAEEARGFAAEYPGDDNTVVPVVWELDGVSLFKGDMRLVAGGESSATSAVLFANYWDGVGSDDPRWGGIFTEPPLWEHLLAPGARVVERVA